jgi:hypothetical protein
MARRSKCKCPKNRKRTKMRKSKKGGENTSESEGTRATKTMKKYIRGKLNRRKAALRRKASRRKAINEGLDTLDPILKEKILAMSGRGKRKKKSKRKKNRKVQKVTKGG